MSDSASAGDDLAAGDFSTWLTHIQAVLRGEHGSDVPCDGCTACCTSYQFVHIEPDEAGTLARIPKELLFPAPGRPRGHRVLGFDEHGRCPMLADNGCSIYEHRPRTCRAYDCRVFAASGVEAEDDRKVLIAQRARRWRFTYGDGDARTRHDAVRSAARFLGEHPDALPGRAPAGSTPHAVAAVEAHEAFLQPDATTGARRVIEPTVDAVRVELRRWTRAG